MKVRITKGPTSLSFTAENNLLPLTMVQNFFANASNFVYELDGEIFTVVVDSNGMIHLVDGIQEYRVFEPDKAQQAPSDFSSFKKERMNNIMHAIKNKDETDCISNVQISTPKRKCDLQRLEVGWKHRGEEFEDYKLMTSPIGGLKVIFLNKSVDYGFQQLLDMCKTEMRTECNAVLFDNAQIILLGDLNGITYEKFTDNNRKECSFWAFSKIKLKTSNRHTKIYIHTTSFKDSSSGSGDTKAKENVNHLNLHVKLNNHEKKQSISPMSKVQIAPAFSNKLFDKSTPAKPCKLSPDGIISFQPDVGSIFKNENPNKSSQVLEENSEKFLMRYSPPPQKLIDKVKVSCRKVKVSDLILTDKVLGKGAFGKVVAATWGPTEVAVKLISLENNNKYIIREIEALDKLQHPNIIMMMAIAEDNHRVYIVFELFKGHTLEALLYNESVKVESPLSSEEKVSILLQVCSVIAHMHSIKVLHKDIKPKNILVNSYNQVKVLDLGLSRLEGLDKQYETTENCNAHGTPTYMGPEILLHNMVATEKVDIWAFAILTVETFNEHNPWNLEYTDTYRYDLKNKLRSDEKPTLENVPAKLHTVLAQCFEREPAERPDIAVLLFFLKNLRKELVNQD